MRECLLLVLLSLSVNLGHAQVIPLLKMLPKGDFNVGLSTGGIDVTAPVSTSVNYLHWYPSNDQPADTWKYEQYVTEFALSEDEAIRNFKLIPSRFGASEQRLDKILDSETYAIPSGELAQGSESLIVSFAGQGAHAYTNALMCESLASFGFEVLSIELDPASGVTSHEGKAQIIKGVVNDFIEDRSGSYSSLAVIGHGDAASALLLYALEPTSIPVTAYVGLDPAFVGNAGLDEIKDVAADRMADFSASMLLAVSGYWKETGERVSDFNSVLFDSAPSANSHMVFMEGLLHHSFVSDMHLRLDNSGVDYTEHGVEQDRKQVDKGYQLLTELVVSFFAQTLNEDSQEFEGTFRKFVSKHSDFMYTLDPKG